MNFYGHVSGLYFSQVNKSIVNKCPNWMHKIDWNVWIIDIRFARKCLHKRNINGKSSQIDRILKSISNALSLFMDTWTVTSMFIFYVLHISVFVRCWWDTITQLRAGSNCFKFTWIIQHNIILFSNNGNQFVPDFILTVIFSLGLFANN